MEGGETSAPVPLTNPSMAKKLCVTAPAVGRTKNVPEYLYSKARESGRPHPARDGELHDEQEIHARLLSDLQDPGESPHDLNKGPHHAGLSGEYDL